jgi:hypothetical protein
MATSSGSTKKETSSLREVLAPIVGVVILLAFATFIIYMLSLTAAEEVVWTRAVYLFSGAQAIAFASAGFFFGSEIQRKRAEQAEERASDSIERAAQAEKEAVRKESYGRSLAEAIRAKAASRSISVERIAEAETKRSDVRLESLGGSERDGLQAIVRTDLMELVDLANRLYP